MDISIFLAKVISLYLIILSIAIFINSARFPSMLNEIFVTPANIFMAGILTLIIGILLVVSHNIWQANWRVVITILAWLTFISGIIRVACPQFAFNRLKKMTKGGFVTISVIALLIGLFLGYFGFFYT